MASLGNLKTRFPIPDYAPSTTVINILLGVTDFFASGKSLYYDDVVIDRLPADVPLVTVDPDPPIPVLTPGGITVTQGVASVTFNTVANYKCRMVYRVNLTSDT